MIRLLGVVAVEDGQIAGLMLTCIDRSREYGAVMECYGLRYASMPVWERWAWQIDETVQQLHDAGVVWGDANAGNVLIDKNNDAWLIRCGKGSTKGWNGREKAGTKKGDMQGVQEIVDYLLSEDHEAPSDRGYASESE